MKKEKIDYLKLIQFNDLILIALILLGLYFAIVLEEIVLKLIGASLAIIGLIGTYINLSQKMSETIKPISKPFVNEPNYKITVKRDTIAKRRIIEDFDDTNQTIENQIDNNKFNKRKIESEKNQSINTNKIDNANEDVSNNDNFRIIKRFKPENENNSQNLKINTPSTKSKNINQNDNADSFTNILVEESNDELKNEVVINRITEQNIDSENIESVENVVIENKLFENSLAESEEIESAIIDQTTKIEDKTEDNNNSDIQVNNKIIKLNFNFNQEKLNERQEIQNNALDFEDDEIDGFVGFDGVENLNFHQEAEKFENENIQFKQQTIDVELINALEENITIDDEPRREFEYFVSRLLLSLRNITDIQTAAFFLFNSEKKEFILESYVTNVPTKIKENARFKFGDDIISQIVDGNKPEILTDINNSLINELFFYYHENSSINSFIGIPITFGNKIIGVIIADSLDNDAFDNNFAMILGQYSKIIGNMLKTYTEKYEYQIDSKILNSIKYFNNLYFNSKVNTNDTISILIESITQNIECNNVGIVVYNETNNNWYINQISNSNSNESNDLLGKNINLNNTLIGQVIKSNKPIYIPKITEDNSNIRIFEGESTLVNGYFVAYPLKSLNQTFGCVFVEGNNASVFSQTELNQIQLLIENTSFVFDKVQLLDIIKNNSIYDSNTGILNPNAMYERIYREIERAKQLGNHPTICLIKIDSYASINSEFKERMSVANQYLINLINNNIRNFDILGQLDEDVYCVMLVGTGLDKSQIWSEKLRSEFAMKELELDGKKFSSTLSIGIANSTRVETVDELISHCAKALNVSIEKTNYVQIFA